MSESHFSQYKELIDGLDGKNSSDSESKSENNNEEGT